MKLISVPTSQKQQVIDITPEVERILSHECKLVNVFAKHTTCSIALADLDPGSDQDYIRAFEDIIPKLRYNHPHDPAHMPDHIASTLVGQQVTMPVVDGKLQLGAWQRIILIDFDGPRKRDIVVTEV